MQIGFFSLLGIVFVVLKLVGVVAWSWWLVLLPFYGSAAAFLALSALVLLARDAHDR